MVKASVLLRVPERKAGEAHIFRKKRKLSVDEIQPFKDMPWRPIQGLKHIRITGPFLLGLV